VWRFFLKKPKGLTLTSLSRRLTFACFFGFSSVINRLIFRCFGVGGRGLWCGNCKNRDSPVKSADSQRFGYLRMSHNFASPTLVQRAAHLAADCPAPKAAILHNVIIWRSGAETYNATLCVNSFPIRRLWGRAGSRKGGQPL